MRIGFLSQEYPPDTGWGGIGTYVYNMAHGLAESGHHVDVITRAVTKDGMVEEGHEGRLRVYRVWPKHYALLNSRSLKLYARFHHVLNRPLGWGYGAYKRLQALSQEQPFDMIEVADHNADGFVFALFRHFKRTYATPLVVKIHVPMLYYHQLNNLKVTLDIRILNMLERQVLALADAITSPSQKMAEIATNLWKLSQRNIEIVPNPIDDDFFVPGTSAPLVPHIVLFVGRLDPQKGVEVLLDAFFRVRQQVPDACLHVVGDDAILWENGRAKSYQAELLQRCQDIGIQDAVRFLGKIARDQLPQLYQQSTVCVIPSKFENFPTVCLEAMACGKPVVASRCGGIPEMIRDGEDGWLVPPENAIAFSEALVNVLKNPSSAAIFGQNARKRIESHYAKRIISQQTVEYYMNTLERTRFNALRTASTAATRDIVF